LLNNTLKMTLQDMHLKWTLNVSGN
jgi:hypothetical protein